MSNRLQKVKQLMMDSYTGERQYIAEIGVEAGVFSLQMINSIPTANILMVDHWQAIGNKEKAIVGELEDIYRIVLNRASQINKDFFDGIRENGCEVVRGTSEEVARILLESLLDGVPQTEVVSLFDLVYIDADHSYAGVTSDLENWFPLVRNGGWIGGHDFSQNFPDVMDAICDFIHRNRLSNISIVHEEDCHLEPSWFIQKLS